MIFPMKSVFGKLWFAALWLCLKDVIPPRQTCDSRWATTQEQQALRRKWALRLSWKSERFDLNSLRAITPAHAAARLLTPTSPLTGWGVGLALRSTGPDLFESLPSIPPTMPWLCCFFALSHTHTRTHRWIETIVQGALSDAGQEISVYVDEAPLPVRSHKAITPLIQTLCVFLDLTSLQKHKLSALSFFTSYFSHTWFSSLSSF